MQLATSLNIGISLRWEKSPICSKFCIPLFASNSTQSHRHTPPLILPVLSGFILSLSFHFLIFLFSTVFIIVFSFSFFSFLFCSILFNFVALFSLVVTFPFLCTFCFIFFNFCMSNACILFRDTLTLFLQQR